MRPGIHLAAALAAAVLAPSAVLAQADPLDAERWLREYEAAFNAKDLDRLGTYYHPDVTIYEGGSIDRGWAAYRDHHLGPELKQMEAPELSHTNVTAHALEGGLAAYVTSEYRLKTRIDGKDIDVSGLATLVLVRDGPDGRWRARHSHTSARRRPMPSPSPSRP